MLSGRDKKVKKKDKKQRAGGRKRCEKNGWRVKVLAYVTQIRKSTLLRLIDVFFLQYNIHILLCCILESHGCLFSFIAFDQSNDIKFIVQDEHHRMQNVLCFSRYKKIVRHTFSMSQEQMKLKLTIAFGAIDSKFFINKILNNAICNQNGLSLFNKSFSRSSVFYI